jgi:carotenoid phi-ring synthase / carotenoid chi-ring synthase
MTWAKERIQQRAGSRDRLEHPLEAIVVGGGIAGLSAACVLAERGAKVTVVEREGYLGGRAGSWRDQLQSGAPFEMERGFHAFFRQYYNLRGILRRVDPSLGCFIPLEDYPLLGPNGASESFARLPKRSPFNVIELVRRTPRLSLMDLLRIRKLSALEMFAYDPDRTYRRFDEKTAQFYLDSLSFPRDARQMLFDVFAHSFFNPEQAMSAGDLLMMFHFYFTGNPEGLVFDVLNAPFGPGLWQPLRRYLERMDVRFLLGETVDALEQAPEAGWQIRRKETDGTLRADCVVLAVDVPALRSIVAESPELGDGAWRRSIETLGVTLPFAVWRRWLDRPARRDRAPFAGTTGLGLLDNISLYETFEDESRRWFEKRGGSVVELHAYAVPESATEEEIRRDLLAGLEEVYPELRGASVIEERFLLRRDCPAFPPGGFRTRPSVETPDSRVALAGDFVSLPIPSALMERAAASGIWAANHLLSRYDVAPEPIWSVPRRGILAPFYN